MGIYDIDYMTAVYGAGKPYKVPGANDEPTAQAMLTRFAKELKTKLPCITDDGKVISFGNGDAHIDFAIHVERLGMVGVGLCCVYTEADKRQTGLATALVEKAIRAADRTNTTLYLCPSPFRKVRGNAEIVDNPPDDWNCPNKQTLTRWYMDKFGFVETDHSHRLMRVPQSKDKPC